VVYCDFVVRKKRTNGRFCDNKIDNGKLRLILYFPHYRQLALEESIGISGQFLTYIRNILNIHHSWFDLYPTLPMQLLLIRINEHGEFHQVLRLQLRWHERNVKHRLWRS
jgi:hypothetical protein